MPRKAEGILLGGLWIRGGANLWAAPDARQLSSFNVQVGLAPRPGCQRYAAWWLWTACSAWLIIGAAQLPGAAVSSYAAAGVFVNASADRARLGHLRLSHSALLA